MLGGRPTEEIPAWLVLNPDLEPGLRPPHVDYEWLLELRSVVVDALVSRGWPVPDPDVAVDSADRVATNGGFLYFQ